MLAFFQLCWFVRADPEGPPPAREVVPNFGKGTLPAGRIDPREGGRIPPDAVPVGVKKRPSGGVDLGGGHLLYPGEGRGRSVGLPTLLAFWSYWFSPENSSSATCLDNGLLFRLIHPPPGRSHKEG